MIEIRRKGQQAITEAHRGAETPLTTHDAKRADGNGVQPVPSLKRPLKPFTALDSSRNYRTMYRAACDFHERNNPPRGGAEYWAMVCADMEQTAVAGGDDPFLMALLVAVFDELEREYKTMTREAGA